MTEKLLTLPLRIGFGAARTTLGITTKVVGTAINLVRPGARHEPPPRPHPPSSRPPEPPREETTREETMRATSPARQAPQRGERRNNGQPEAPARPAASPPPVVTEATPPSEQPDTPISPAADAAKTVDDQDEVVATFAESGAEDGAGAQLAVEEPWEGYAEMKADAVIARIGEASAAELAVVELYESTHKKRQTVMNAATRRLRALSPPQAE